MSKQGYAKCITLQEEDESTIECFLNFVGVAHYVVKRTIFEWSYIRTNNTNMVIEGSSYMKCSLKGFLCDKEEKNAQIFSIKM